MNLLVSSPPAASHPPLHPSPSQLRESKPSHLPRVRIAHKEPQLPKSQSCSYPCSYSELDPCTPTQLLPSLTLLPFWPWGGTDFWPVLLHLCVPALWVPNKAGVTWTVSMGSATSFILSLSPEKTNRERRVGRSKGALFLLHQIHPPIHSLQVCCFPCHSTNIFLTSTTCQALRVQRLVSTGPVLRKFRGGNGKRESQASQQLHCRVMSIVLGGVCLCMWGKLRTL